MAQPLCSREWKKGVPGDKAAEKKEGAVMTRYTALLSRNHHDDTRQGRERNLVNPYFSK